MRTLLALLVSMAVLSTSACVERSRGMSSAERQQLQRFVSTTAPAPPQHRLDVKFEDKITLLGYDVSPATAAPGQTVTVTWHWKAEKRTGDGWRLFTHVADAAGVNKVNQDGVGLVRERYQPFQWQAGEYIRDEQRITIPEDWNSPTMRLFLGIWKDSARLRIVSGPKDAENRVPALTIPITAGRAPAPAPTTVRALKATTPIAIDGRLDEPAWQTAFRTEAFVNTMSGAESDAKARARFTWDDSNLYVAFEVEDTFLKSSLPNRDDHLWDQDTIEVMVDPLADGRNYFEIQVAPTGNVFDTRYDTRRRPQPFGDVEWNSRVDAKVVTRGTVNDDDEDEGYTVELALPWAGFDRGTPAVTAPTNGTTWAMNLYVMDSPEEGQQRSGGWTAVREPDFHAIGRFTRIEFVDPSAPAQAAPAAPAVEATPAAEGPATPEETPPAAIAPGAPLNLRDALRAKPRKLRGGMPIPTTR